MNATKKTPKKNQQVKSQADIWSCCLKNKSAVAHLNQNKCPCEYISEPMGVKGNPSMAELNVLFL